MAHEAATVVGNGASNMPLRIQKKPDDEGLPELDPNKRLCDNYCDCNPASRAEASAAPARSRFEQLDALVADVLIILASRNEAKAEPEEQPVRVHQVAWRNPQHRL